MKSFLNKSLYLLAFVIAGIVFQISCSNSDETAAVQNISQIQKIIYLSQQGIGPIELWTSNYDGTNQTIIPITLPANVGFSTMNSNRASIKLSPDGQTVFFIGFNNATNSYAIYSCDISGGNLQEVVAPSTSNVLELGGAY